ncbi:hypothetical protein WBG78_00705 [Chryseolinea sp. T2]|uniref:hypothetical protein n=1 Tax=Chryseolinea sp. T2 TaxID=3129255 RepID=UPI003077D05B
MNFPRSLVASTGGLLIAGTGGKQSCFSGGRWRRGAKEFARKFVLADTMDFTVINLTEYISKPLTDESVLSASTAKSQFDSAIGKLSLTCDAKNGQWSQKDLENCDSFVTEARLNRRSLKEIYCQFCEVPKHRPNTLKSVRRFAENGVVERDDVGIMVDIYRSSTPMRSAQTVNMICSEHIFGVALVSLAGSAKRNSRGGR